MDESLTEILAKMDWKKILKEAVESRPSSWSSRPVVEWRNASDTVFCALMNELRRKGYVT